MTHICASKLTTSGSDNALSPGLRQAIIWTKAGILSTGPLRTHFSEIFIEIHIAPFRKMHLNVSVKWQPFCLSVNWKLLVESLAVIGWCFIIPYITMGCTSCSLLALSIFRFLPWCIGSKIHLIYFNIKFLACPEWVFLTWNYERNITVHCKLHYQEKIYYMKISSGYLLWPIKCRHL